MDYYEPQRSADEVREDNNLMLKRKKLTTGMFVPQEVEMLSDKFLKMLEKLETIDCVQELGKLSEG